LVASGCQIPDSQPAVAQDHSDTSVDPDALIVRSAVFQGRSHGAADGLERRLIKATTGIH
jgi:hypothetical protein